MAIRGEIIVIALPVLGILKSLYFNPTSRIKKKRTNNIRRFNLKNKMLI